jgi:hypothetical protein
MATATSESAAPGSLKLATHRAGPPITGYVADSEHDEALSFYPAVVGGD